MERHTGGDLDAFDPEAFEVAFAKEMLRAAAAQPSVLDSTAPRVLPLNLRPRPNGYWAIYRGPFYLRTTGTKDHEQAEKKLRLALLQEMAARRGLSDLQQADLIEVCDKYKKLGRYKRRLRKAERAVNIRNGLKRLRPHIEGLRVGQLDNDRVDAIVEQLKAEGYGYGTIVNSFDHLTTAIKSAAKKGVECVLPFDPLPRAPGRTRLVEAHEQARALRWARGEETYDPATDTWSPPQRPLSAKKRHVRSQFERMFVLGLGTGSRPGRWEQLAWGPNYVCGWIDVAGCTMYRLPLGADPDLLKEAPPVLLSASTMARVRCWRAEDPPDQPWVIRTFDGRNSPRNAQSLFFRTCRVLGLVGVTRHTVRHSMISGCVARGVPVEPLSQTAGVSPWVLRHRYNHSDARSVQPLAHEAIDQLLAEGIPVIRAGRPPAG